MKQYAGFLFLLCCTLSICAQVHYTMTYLDSSAPVVRITITPPAPVKAPISFVMPRSAPGDYSVCMYDKFIQNIFATTQDNEKIPMIKDEDDAPRWHCNDSGKAIIKVEYEVNLLDMEMKMLATDASIVRPGFAGLLNYSLFGWLDGMENGPVIFTIMTFSSWPIFNTIEPSANPTHGSLTINVDNYHILADGQVFIGPRFRVKEFDGPVPCYVVSFCETADEYLDDYGAQEVMSMKILKEYFGDLPFKHYSLMLRAELPPAGTTAPPFAMEHSQSSTFFGDTSYARTKPMDKKTLKATLFPFLHHMGHSFIPLTCYGDSYRPYVMEIPPVINNIWFNEGFIWFLCNDTLKSKAIEKFLEESVYGNDKAVKDLGLFELSQIGSTQYASDFRIGRAIFSRGALMATEMNKYIIEKTNGKRSMRDVLRFLYTWSKHHQRSFTMQEFPSLIDEGSGVKLDGIYRKWQLPIK